MRFEAESYTGRTGWRVSIEGKRGEVVAYRKWLIAAIFVAIKRFRATAPNTANLKPRTKNAE